VHADVEFLKALPGIRIGRGDVIEVDNQMGIGHPGIFAGGDMIGGARTMPVAVGHGKKAARNIDAWLRGEVFDKPPKHAVVQFETLNLPVFLDAERRQQGEIPAEQRKGFEEVVAGLSESEARYEASRCLSCGNCFECDNCYASCPEQAIIKLGKGHFYRYDYDLCTGCAVCYEQCPCHAIEMLPEPAVAATTAASSREATMPAKFKVRS
jgi:formate dehydrogenase beta subunit